MNTQNPEAPLHVAEHPMVVRTSADTVIIECSGPHASVLAEILARYDALRAAVPGMEPIKHYEPEVWHHTMFRLLVENARLRYPVAETVEVDTSRVDLVRRDPRLHVVEGGAR